MDATLATQISSPSGQNLIAEKLSFLSIQPPGACSTLAKAAMVGLNGHQPAHEGLDQVPKGQHDVGVPADLCHRVAESVLVNQAGDVNRD